MIRKHLLFIYDIFLEPNKKFIILHVKIVLNSRFSKNSQTIGFSRIFLLKLTNTRFFDNPIYSNSLVEKYCKY